MLFGDFGQLPPVMDRPLYAQIDDTMPLPLQTASRIYRTTFNKVFELTQQMRQQGSAAEDLQFQRVLSNLRRGQVEREDWTFLQGRVLVNLTLQEREVFNTAIWLFPLTSTVDDKNIAMLESLGGPVARIEAAYHNISREEGCKVDGEYCNNMEHDLYLSVGCRVRSQDIQDLILGHVDQEYLANKRPLQRFTWDSLWVAF